MTKGFMGLKSAELDVSDKFADVPIGFPFLQIGFGGRNIPDDSSNVEELLSRHQVKARLERIIDLAEMPEGVKAAGVLYFFDGYSPSEISDEIGVSYGIAADYVKRFIGFLLSSSSRRRELKGLGYNSLADEN